MCIQAVVEMKTVIYREDLEFIWMLCWSGSYLEIVSKLLPWQLNPNSYSKRSFNFLPYKSQQWIEFTLEKKCHAFRGPGLFVGLSISENFCWMSLMVSFNIALWDCSSISSRELLIIWPKDLLLLFVKALLICNYVALIVAHSSSGVVVWPQAHFTVGSHFQASYLRRLKYFRIHYKIEREIQMGWRKFTEGSRTSLPATLFRETGH